MPAFFGPLCRIAAVVLLVGLVYGAGAFAQEKHAILVGVSGYPNLRYEDRLNIGSEEDPTKDGPANDVSAMKATLLQRGFEDANILVLADGIAGTPLPTRENIINAFGATAARLNAGREDYVFVFFAGHGSQQPARQGLDESDEPDQLDEIFLPYDVMPWDAEKQVIPNAILDDEVGWLLAGLRNKRAFVWMVADTCHSATLTRSVADHGILGEGAKFRTLDLMGRSTGEGQSGDAVSDVSQRSVATVERVYVDEDAGGFVGFFAAQSHQSAPQARLPRGADAQKTRGWFTYAFNTILSDEPDLTYGQLSQRILDVYNAEFISRFVTPYYEGTDRFQGAAVFEDHSVGGQAQWQVRKDYDGNLVLAAGLLHGIGEGTKLAIYPTASAKAQDLLGYVEVTHALATEAVVARSKADDDGASEPQRLPARAWARLVEKKPALALRIGVGSSGSGDGARDALLREVLQDVVSTQEALSFVGSDHPKDVTLELRGDKMVFLGPEGETVAKLAAGFETSELRNSTSEVLDAIYKTTLLKRVAARAADEMALEGVSVEMTLCPQASEDCERFEQEPGTQSAQLPDLKPGDVLRLTVQNPKIALVDYTVLHVDPQLNISAVSQGRISKSETPQRIMAGVITPDTLGSERVFVILVEGRPGEEISSFAFLQEPSQSTLAGLEKNRSTGGAKPSNLPAERTEISVFQWQTTLH